MIVPKHYDKPVQPWDLERCMESSGNAFVDARRTDAIEYCFRKKDNMLEDLRKAAHCIQAAIEVLEGTDVAVVQLREMIPAKHADKHPGNCSCIACQIWDL